MSISIDSLKRAVSIAEQIESLKSQLASILGQKSTSDSLSPAAPAKRRGRPPGVSSPAPSAAKPAVSPKGKISALGLANIRAAQKARWARAKGIKPAVKAPAPPKPAKKKSKLSAAGRAAIVAALKARWAKVKAEKAKK